MTTPRHSDIPVFILAGGLGTRISEETDLRPKPMIEVGDIPVLVHLMRWYYSFGFNDFIICAGYKSWSIKQFFLNYMSRMNHIEIDHRDSLTRPMDVFGTNHTQEKWRVRVIDTGLNTMTGARIARAFDTVAPQSPFEHFAVTYGDGLSNVDLSSELQFHLRHGKTATVLGVRPTARFGELDLASDGTVQSFVEKPQAKQGLVNGGFFFFKRDFRRYLGNDETCILEKSPLETLVRDRGLVTMIFDGFWQPMDTLRDKNYLQGLWDSGKAPWKTR